MKRHFLLFCGLTQAGLVAAGPAFAAPLLATNVAGIFSYPAPPAGFDAYTASRAELDRYGFPPRPSLMQIQARRNWEALVKFGKTRIQPILRPTDVAAGVARHARVWADALAPDSTQYSLNWSGEILLSSVTGYGQGAFNGLAAIFNVPVASQAFGACTGGWDYVSSWVGIDGWDTKDVFQAGVESDAYCNGSNTQQYYTAWVEWYPENETQITNLPITAGDVALVWMLVDSATSGRAIVVNETTGQSVIMSLTAPAGVTLRGDSAEWIMERPEVSNKTATMSNYVQAWMSDENAGVVGYSQNVNYAQPSPGAVPFLVTMLNVNYGPVISSAVSLGGTATVFKDAGPAK